jgi:altronate hydrolase
MRTGAGGAAIIKSAQLVPNVTPAVNSGQARVLQIHPEDNVLVALTDLRKGEAIKTAEHSLVLETDVSAKHKFTLEALKAGDAVTMYGVRVGRAMEPIRKGEVITTHNTRHDAAAVEGRTATYHWTAPDVSRWKQQTFQGFRRSDGQVGTRNHWLVVPLVFCENRNVQYIREAFEKELGFAPVHPYRTQVAEMVKLYQAGKIKEIEALRSEPAGETGGNRKIFSNVDGIKFLTHEGGCGGTREDSDILCGLIAGYIHHPNVAGATILSLGCQHAQVPILERELKKRDPNFNKPLLIFEQQQSGTEFQMLSQAIRQTFLGLVEANKAERTPAPLSALSVGLKCGGSDGFSGISANPAIGHVADIMAALEGKGILAEFPELCGVEQDLVNRSITDEVGQRFLHLMHAYDARARAVDSGFSMNPSPGNIRDGLITDAMKSAGAARKGGTSPVTDVLDYPGYATRSGLNLLCTPGNDLEAVSGQVGAGASVVLFTTGLGTPTGNPIAPVVKVSTNTRLAERMPDIIDIDTGPVISGEKTVEQMGEAILELVVKIASGEVKTKAERLGQDDFIPWKRGVSL